MFDALAQFTPWLLYYKYFFLFPLLLVEGPIVTVFAGFLASLDQLNFWIAYILVVVANMASDSILYVVGRWGRRWWKFFKVKQEKIIGIEEHFKKHKIKTLLASKLAFGIGNVGLVAVGVAKVPYWEYIKINFLIELPKALVFFLLGYYFGYAYATIDKYLKFATAFLIFGGIAIILSYWLFRKWFTKNYKNL
jgi:membrane protein DedA with SNARE-associated domain